MYSELMLRSQARLVLKLKIFSNLERITFIVVSIQFWNKRCYRIAVTIECAIFDSASSITNPLKPPRILMVILCNDAYRTDQPTLAGGTHVIGMTGILVYVFFFLRTSSWTTIGIALQAIVAETAGSDPRSYWIHNMAVHVQVSRYATAEVQLKLYPTGSRNDL